MSERLAESGRRRRRPDDHQVDVHRAVQSRPGRAAALHRLSPRSAARRWARGSPTASAPRAGTCPASSSLSQGDRCPAPAKRPGAAAFCRRSIKACNAAPAAIRCCTLSNPEGMDRQLRRMSLDALRDLNEVEAEKLGQPETATRIAQYETGVSHADRRARGDGHLAASRRMCWPTTGPSRARRASPTTACSPGGWSSRACASCSCSTGAGTFTAPMPAKTSRPAWSTVRRRWTSRSPR